MKLISASIENFGRLSHETVDFSEGLNVRLAENGHGKTTLAAFLCVMLYGFAGESKRSDTENERKRFKPWQGGVYGGELTFEAKGKTYIVTRIFGAKESEDDFLVRSAVTGLPVDDFSKNLGEELFEIDRDSFLRTVFISQNDCFTEATGSINAKLGNLAMDTGDIDTFESVEKKLSDLENALSARRKTGQIYKKKRKKEQLIENIRRKDGLIKSIEEMKDLRDAKRDECEAVKNRQEEVKEQLSKISADKDRQSEREQYGILKAEIEKRRNALHNATAAFPGDVPSAEEIDVQLSLDARLGELCGTLEHLAPSREQERIFGENLTTEQEIDEFIACYNERNMKNGGLTAKRTTLETLQNIVRTEEMQHAQRELSRKRRQDAKEQLDRRQAEKASKGKRKSIIKLILGVICLVLIFPAISLLADSGLSRSVRLVAQTAVGVMLLLVGLYLVVSGMVRLLSREDEEISYPQDEDDPMKLTDSRNQLEALRREFDSDVGFIDETDAAVKAYCERLSITYDEPTFLGTMQELKNSAKLYEKNHDRYEQARAEHEMLENKQQTFFDRYRMELSERPSEQLLEIREKLSALTTCRRELEAAESRKQAFLRERKLTEQQEDAFLSEKQSSGSVEALSEQLAALTDQLSDGQDALRDYTARLSDLYEELDRIGEDETALEEVTEDISRTEQRLSVIILTKKYLQEAKVSFTEKYMQPIMDGFSDYYEILAGSKPEDYRIDANMAVTKKEAGLPRNTGFLSQGYRDLIAICMRMALVSAMYEDEKPPLIFDDPFVNLDTEKTEYGRKLLARIAKDYQIIYFTCHESRALN